MEEGSSFLEIAVIGRSREACSFDAGENNHCCAGNVVDGLGVLQSTSCAATGCGSEEVIHIRPSDEESLRLVF